MEGPGDIWPCELGVLPWCIPPMGESLGGGELDPRGWPVSILGGATDPPGAFIIFLYLDLRFWNQIFTCKKKHKIFECVVTQPLL